MQIVRFNKSGSSWHYERHDDKYQIVRDNTTSELPNGVYDYVKLLEAERDWINSLHKVQHIKGTKTYIIALDGKKYTYIRGCEIPFMQYGMYESERPALFDELGNLVDYDSKELNKVIEAFKNWKWTYNL